MEIALTLLALWILFYVTKAVQAYGFQLELQRTRSVREAIALADARSLVARTKRNG